MVSLEAHTVDAGVRPPTACELLEDHRHIYLLVADHLRRACLAGLVEAVVEAIDRDDLAGSQHQRAGDREKSHRPGSPDRYHVSLADVT